MDCLFQVIYARGEIMKIKLASGYDGDQSDWQEFLIQWKKNLKKGADVD